MRLGALLSLVLVVGCGANSDYGAWDPYALDNAAGGTEEGAVTEQQAIGLATDDSGRAGRRESRGRGPGAAVAPAEAMFAANDGTVSSGLPVPEPELVSNGDVPSLERDAERNLPLLIYMGDVTLAIYDVEETKAAVVDLAERMHGYAAQRTDQAVVIRVPAERFRDTLDELGELGDVLRETWSAQDVTDQFNDLEVRLANARNMRDRLEELLDEAENVSDALAIERELERVTLEIERLEGQRRHMVDRIAFATITVSFARIPVTDVPGEEYRLPFQWLNQIGVERLLSL